MCVSPFLKQYFYCAKREGGRMASAPSEEKKQDPYPCGRAETAESAGVSRSEERRQQPHQAAGRRAPYRPQPRGRAPAAVPAALGTGIAAGDAYRLVHQLAGADAAAVRGEDEYRLFKYPRVGGLHDDDAAGNAFYQNRCLLAAVTAVFVTALFWPRRRKTIRRAGEIFPAFFAAQTRWGSSLPSTARTLTAQSSAPPVRWAD